MPDIIKYEILQDGTIRFQTDAVSAAAHASADEFLAQAAALAGGTRTTRDRADVPQVLRKNTHTHANGVTHSH